MSEMTYASLVNDVQTYIDRSDTPFTSQIPSFISLAENRIASEIHALGYKRFVTTTFAQDVPVVDKPIRWRETVSISVGTGTTQSSQKFLFYRGYQYCRTFWPLVTSTGEPRYYADYDYDHWLITPTPNRAYEAEIVYHERPLQLSDSNQQNWSTKFAPQLLLYATLLETAPFLMSDERLPMWQALYDRAAAGITNEDKRRMIDESDSRRAG